MGKHIFDWPIWKISIWRRSGFWEEKYISFPFLISYLNLMNQEKKLYKLHRTHPHCLGRHYLVRLTILFMFEGKHTLNKLTDRLTEAMSALTSCCRTVASTSRPPCVRYTRWPISNVPIADTPANPGPINSRSPNSLILRLLSNFTKYLFSLVQYVGSYVLADWMTAG